MARISEEAEPSLYFKCEGDMKLNPERTLQVYSDAACSTKAQLTNLLSEATLSCPAEEGFISGELHATDVYKITVPKAPDTPITLCYKCEQSTVPEKENQRTAPTAAAAASLPATTERRNAPQAPAPAPVKKECKIVITVEAATKHTTTPPPTTPCANVSSAATGAPHESSSTATSNHIAVTVVLGTAVTYKLIFHNWPQKKRDQ
ncbi:SAG-related sequence SRS45 [Toxoplasma gondii GT1]|uniref:SAG-related sequence SRS45 n=2 Tax=Toxoplasma gondii TaxID=5811 RepID=S7W647_TOXGG|nr:SAG-related sequence SRS45 [Toxoplasma gondii GT1]KAF4640265.1 SAG-related sequence SRS45 [Toxoplasma gondii]